MSITTYSELQTAAANWLDRTDLTDRIPEMIDLAEAGFNRRIRTPDMVTKDDTFTVDDQYVARPSGFLEARRFTLLTNPVIQLEYLTPEEMSQARELYSSSGEPVYFTAIGSNFEFLPSPDSSYTASLIYYGAISALSDANTSNWLLTDHPDIYLFGTLVEAEPYLKNDERIAVWERKLRQAESELKIQAERERMGTTPRPRFTPFA